MLAAIELNSNMNKFDCHIYGPIFSNNGVGASTRAYWRLLSASGMKVGVWPQNAPLDEKEKTIARKYGNLIVDKKHPNLNFFRINAMEIEDNAHLIEGSDSSQNILIPMWETEFMPRKWMADIERFSGLIAATNFIANSVLPINQKIPVWTIPHPIEVESNSWNSVKMLGLADDRRYFIYSFSYASFASRKQPEQFLNLAKLWKELKPNSTDVFVLTAGDKPIKQSDVKLAELFKQSSSHQFKYIEGTKQRDVHIALLANANLFISMHRSEGIGLQLAESALLNTPFVSHVYSGPRDFIPTGMSGIYDHNLISIGKGEYPSVSHGTWADYNLLDVTEAMQKALGNSDQDLLEINKKVKNHFSIFRNTDKINLLLKELSTN